MQDKHFFEKYNHTFCPFEYVCSFGRFLCVFLITYICIVCNECGNLKYETGLK